MRFRICKIVPVKNHRGPEPLAIRDFNQGSVLRHYNGSGNPEKFSLVNERLSVVAGRSRNHAALFLVGCELSQSVARAAFFKTAGPLRILELAEDLHSAGFAERNRMLAGGWKHRAFDAIARGFDFFKCDHAL